MKTYPDCIVCYLRQVLEALDLNRVDEAKKREVIFRAASKMKRMDFSKSPFENTGVPHGVVAKMLGVDDPYAVAKEEMNRKARNIVDKLHLPETGQSSKHFEFLLRASAIGNWLDYGPPVEKNLERVNELIKNNNVIASGYMDNFWKLEKILLGKKLRIGFLGDNAGEIFFDKALIAHLSRKHEVTYFVKEKPWINDAMLKDAEIAGIKDYAILDTVPISNWKLGLRSQKFLAKLRNFDVVIAKGQGNYETLAQEKLRCFYLLITKCKLVAAELGVEQGKIVLEATEV
ncbi:MAG: ARMT1-like domain-containing protein [Thermoplasmata archaeon]